MGLVLIVDDEAQVTLSIQRLLRRQGYAVRTAASGSEALLALEGVDVVLTDLRMPGMNGIELATEVKRRQPGTRCCVMSGDGGVSYDGAPVTGAPERSPNVDARMGKPFSHAELLEMLRQLGCAPSRPP